MTLSLGKDTLTCHTLVSLSQQENPAVNVDPESLKLALKHHQTVLDVVKNDRTVYGINTGFGYLAGVKIPNDKLDKLQVNLIRSHACGVGKPCDDEVVRGLLVLRAHSFLQGHSGISERVLQTILNLLPSRISPEPAQRSNQQWMPLMGLKERSWFSAVMFRLWMFRL